MPRKRLDALIAIGQLIAPKARLADELVQACEAPEDYADAFAGQLDDGDPEAGRAGPIDLPWTALIRGLGRAGAVVELDGSAGAEALRRSLEQLEGCPRGAFAWMKHDGELADRSTAELVELAGKSLLARGAVLAALAGQARRRDLSHGRLCHGSGWTP